MRAGTDRWAKSSDRRLCVAEIRRSSVADGGAPVEAVAAAAVLHRSGLRLEHVLSLAVERGAVLGPEDAAQEGVQAAVAAYPQCRSRPALGWNQTGVPSAAICCICSLGQEPESATTTFGATRMSAASARDTRT